MLGTQHLGGGNRGAPLGSLVDQEAVIEDPGGVDDPLQGQTAGGDAGEDGFEGSAIGHISVLHDHSGTESFELGDHAKLGGIGRPPRQQHQMAAAGAHQPAGRGQAKGPQPPLISTVAAARNAGPGAINNSGGAGSSDTRSTSPA